MRIVRFDDLYAKERDFAPMRETEVALPRVRQLCKHLRSARSTQARVAVLEQYEDVMYPFTCNEEMDFWRDALDCGLEELLKDTLLADHSGNLVGGSAAGYAYGT